MKYCFLRNIDNFIFPPRDLEDGWRNPNDGQVYDLTTMSIAALNAIQVYEANEIVPPYNAEYQWINGGSGVLNGATVDYTYNIDTIDLVEYKENVGRYLIRSYRAWEDSQINDDKWRFNIIKALGLLSEGKKATNTPFLQAVVDMAVNWDTKAGQFDTVKQAIIDAITHDDVLAQKVIIDNFNT